MRSIRNPTLICIKGFLFLALGLLAATMLLMRAPTPIAALLLAITIWAFCRFYYFAFHVIEHHVDPAYRFGGLLALAAYALRRRKSCDFPGDKSRAAG